MHNKTENEIKGIPVGMMNYIMAAATLVVSVLLMFTSQATREAYTTMRTTTDSYLSWQSSAVELVKGSDYLTNQVRCFAATGEQEYMDNYFREANEDRHRDQALEELEESQKDSQAYQELQAAMSASVHLMKQEYYSMRLTAGAFDYDLDALPAEVAQVELTAEDMALSQQEQKNQALRLVFDKSYQEQKDTIIQDMDNCLDDLADQMQREQTTASERLLRLLVVQRIFVILLILIVLVLIVTTTTLVISPLLRAVLHIREEQPIPIRGSYEFRFLAQTYNLMYEINRESRQKLAFAASHDKLTGLYNRSGYDYAMEHEDLSHGALLLVDVDQFKRINDSFGHEMGDRMLVWVAQVLQGSFRSEDHVCRIGGDEFAVLMHNVKPQHVRLIENKVEVINMTLTNPEDDRPPVSISVGIAFGEEGSTPEKLYENADKALYQVKERGRRGSAVAG
jgi:diguanylate cyclase (GGDEF)-like protein